MLNKQETERRVLPSPLKSPHPEAPGFGPHRWYGLPDAGGSIDTYTTFPNA